MNNRVEILPIDSLWHLDLEDNSLTGNVPSQLGLLAMNGLLDHVLLRGNELNGVVSQDLCSINRTWFDCSNALCGCDCPCSANETLGGGRY